MAISFKEALITWAKIGCLSFGGPAGQIALMHRELVDEKKWLTEQEYLSALNFCMLLPGPEAMQLATYAGWRLHGLRGGLAAGLLFVLPGALVVLALSAIYATFGRVALVEAIFFGVKAAVLAIVIEALLRVARRALKTPADWWIALAAFVGLFCFAIPFPAIILLAALLGYWRKRKAVVEASSALPSLWPALKTFCLWLVIWLGPLACLMGFFGGQHVYTQLAVFFAKLAVVTFGGAYAVLSYMAQAAVEQQGWLSPAQMIDGLGLAETTPGPLILVTEFVAFMAAHSKLGGVLSGLIGAAIALWMTFAPSFMFIFAGGPYVVALGRQPKLSGALSAITAAVVGVIFNLTVWFGLHVLFGGAQRHAFGVFQPWVPDFSQLNLAALAISLLSALLLLRLHIGLFATLAIAAVAGCIRMVL